MFKFRLEPLITIRDKELKDRQEELAQAYNARRILEEAMQMVEQQLAEGIATARNLTQAGKTVNVNHLLGLRRQEMFLRANQDDLTNKIKVVDEEIERRRLLVVAANKELKIVEKLKEKRHEKYMEEENKEETKAMDEIAGNKRTVHSI
jgi:flagellar FliJ protein